MLSCFQSQVVRDLLQSQPEPPVTYKEATRTMNLLMTMAVVANAGRPSHVTGVTTKELLEARVSASPMTSLLISLYDLT